MDEFDIITRYLDTVTLLDDLGFTLEILQDDKSGEPFYNITDDAADEPDNILVTVDTIAEAHSWAQGYTAAIEPHIVEPAD